MKVLAGDWMQDSPVKIKRTITGKPRAMVLMEGHFTYDKIPMKQIRNVEVVTEENKTSILGRAAWGVAGASMVRDFDLLAGGPSSGASKRMTFSIEFRDGRQALLQCKAKEFREIYAAQFRK